MRPKQARPGNEKPAQALRRQARWRKRDVTAAQQAANSYCLRQYGIRCSGGIPRLLSLHGADVWIVPVIFTSLGYGPVAEVGLVAIDAVAHEVVGATPRQEVRAAVSRVAEEKKDALEAAFHQASNA